MDLNITLKTIKLNINNFKNWSQNFVLKSKWSLAISRKWRWRLLQLSNNFKREYFISAYVKYFHIFIHFLSFIAYLFCYFSFSQIFSTFFKPHLCWPNFFHYFPQVLTLLLDLAWMSLHEARSSNNFPYKNWNFKCVL
jgi:hypothetical protein